MSNLTTMMLINNFWLLWFQAQFEQDLIIVMWAIGICVPSVFVFIESLTKSVFGNKEWPTFGTIFIVRMSTYVLDAATRKLHNT